MAIATFGRAKEGWLRTFLALPHGIPSHDTFGRVFARLAPEAFGRCFLAWTQAVAPECAAPDTERLRALDGKIPRGARDRANGKAALHLVRAWASDSGRGYAASAWWRLSGRSPRRPASSAATTS